VPEPELYAWYSADEALCQEMNGGAAKFDLIRSPRRAELQVLAMLGTARPVVEIGSLVAAVGDRRESVVRVHDGFDEYHRVVWRAEGVLQVPAGLDDERSRRAVATEYFREIGVGPVSDVIIGFRLAEVEAFDSVSAVVDQEDQRAGRITS
jgi:hypothetical protein